MGEVLVVSGRRRELPRQIHPSDHPYGAATQPQPVPHLFRAPPPRSLSSPLWMRKLSSTDAPASQARLIWRSRSAPDQSPPQGGVAEFATRSLQILSKFADKILDLFRVMTMTNQNSISRPHDNQIVDAKQRDRRIVGVKDDVVRRIEGSDLTIGCIPLV